MLPNLDAIVYARWFSFLNRSLTCLHEQMEIQVSNRLIWGRDAAVKWDDRGLAVGIAHNINAEALGERDACYDNSLSTRQHFTRSPRISSIVMTSLFYP